MVKLTEKQRRFCEEYMVDLNATRAAIRAGYSEKTARKIGSENLTKQDISKYIQELREMQQKRTKITSDMVIAEYAKIAFFDIRKVFNPDGTLKQVTELDDISAGAISSIKSRLEKHGPDKEDWTEIIECKTVDKKGALDSIAKYFGILDGTGGDNDDDDGVLEVEFV